MLNKNLIRWLFRTTLILPIIPIVLNIIYLNQYSGFDATLRLNISLIFIFGYLAFLMFGCYFIQKKKQIVSIIFVVLSIIGFGVGTYFSYVNMRVYNSLNNMTTQNSVINYSVVTMSNSSIDNVSQLNGKTIGVLKLSNEEVIENIESYLTKQGIDESTTVESYDSPIPMLHDLYNEKLDGIIIGDNYASLFSEQLGFSDIKNETQVLATIQTVIKSSLNQSNMSNSSLIDKPFSMLLIGVDSTEEGLEAHSLADSLIVATVNPKNLSVTMTSIPRDSYVEIPCFNYSKDKITHSNNGGTTCVIESVERMFDMEIPYYVKINFKGVVELVDAIGGIYVDVPVAIEEQDSNRRFGDHLIKIDEGYQRLNGEQALALSRHRKTLAKGDLGRAEHQQLVIEGILNQMLSEMNTVNEFLGLLDVLGNNIETNISIGQMTSGLQYLLGLVPTFIGSNPLDNIYIKSMVLSAEYGYLNNPYYGFKLSYAFPYQGAIEDAKQQMLVNLEQVKPEVNYSFTFNSFEEYKGAKWVKSYYAEESPLDVQNDYQSKPSYTTPSNNQTSTTEPKPQSPSNSDSDTTTEDDNQTGDNGTKPPTNSDNQTNNQGTGSGSTSDTEVEVPSEDNTNDGSNEVQPPTTPDTEVETPSDGNMNGGGNEVQSPITPDSGTGTNNNDSQTPKPEETVTPNEQQSQNLEDSLQ